MSKILLVEDNEMNRDLPSRRLQKQGYEVVMTVDGEGGVAKAQSETPALILMDMTLPGIDVGKRRGATRLRLPRRTFLSSLDRTRDERRPRKGGGSGLQRLRYLLTKIQALLGLGTS